MKLFSSSLSFKFPIFSHKNFRGNFLSLKIILKNCHEYNGQTLFLFNFNSSIIVVLLLTMNCGLEFLFYFLIAIFFREEFCCAKGVEMEVKRNQFFNEKKWEEEMNDNLRMETTLIWHFSINRDLIQWNNPSNTI